MDFSIVVPNLNSPIVDRTIISLEKQIYKHIDYEIIVVGMDHFGLIRDSELVNIDNTLEPISPAKARNRGAKQAHGEIIAFIDADCVAYPNWLTTLALRFSNPNVHVIGGGVEFEKNNYWTIADNLSMFYNHLSILQPGLRSQLPSLNLAIRRETFNEIGGFDERYPLPSGEDADLTLRLRKQGYLLYFEPKAVVLHAPQRNRLMDLVRHSYNQGKYSTKIDPRYAYQEGLPWPVRTRLGVILFSPMLATFVTSKMFIKNKELFRYWYTIPALFLAKFTWCIGAAVHPTLQ